MSDAVKLPTVTWSKGNLEQQRLDLPKFADPKDALEYVKSQRANGHDDSTYVISPADDAGNGPWQIREYQEHERFQSVDLDEVGNLDNLRKGTLVVDSYGKVGQVNEASDLGKGLAAIRSWRYLVDDEFSAGRAARNAKEMAGLDATGESLPMKQAFDVDKHSVGGFSLRGARK